MSERDAKEGSAEHLLQQSWSRIRTRSFAHEIASTRIRKKVRSGFRVEMLVAVAGLIFLISGLSIVDGGFSKLLPAEYKDLCEISSRGLIYISVLCTICSLYISAVSHGSEALRAQGGHEICQAVYAAVSQKSRRPQADIYRPEFDQYLIWLLNDYLETMMGLEETPTDKDYDDAHKRMEKNLNQRQYPWVSDVFFPGGEKDREAFVKPEEASEGAPDEPQADPNLAARIGARFRSLGAWIEARFGGATPPSDAPPSPGSASPPA